MVDMVQRGEVVHVQRGRPGGVGRPGTERIHRAAVASNAGQCHWNHTKEQRIPYTSFFMYREQQTYFYKYNNSFVAAHTFYKIPSV